MNDNWYQADNVAKIFLASYNKRDTRSLRVSCTLTEKVDPTILQNALINTIKARPQFQVRIRRGFFWHYIETTGVRPLVHIESDRPCPLLYGQTYNGVLHYQVTYYNKRINLDLFHAISDGTGALEFLNVLLANYLKLKYPSESESFSHISKSSEDDRSRDAYKQYYDNNIWPELKLPELKLPDLKRTYQPQGRRLPYDQLQFFELHMPNAPLINKSKELKVSLTSYLGALLMFSIYKDMPTRHQKRPITISLPVNLRNFFPSETTRNFFNNVNVSHIFTGDETIEDLSLEFNANLKAKLSKESIKKQMNEYEKFENLIIARMVPLFIKMPVLNFITQLENKKVSAVVSNLGPQKLPESMSKYVEEFSAFCSSSNMFMTMTSYQDKIILGISTPFVNTSIIRNFTSYLQETTTDVVLYATDIVRY